MSRRDQGESVSGGSLQHTDGRLAWWRRPSPLWILATCPLLTIAQAVTIAPRIAIFTTLVCLVHKPELASIDVHEPGFSSISTDHWISVQVKPDLCASDPVVQAGVATLTLVIATSTGILTCLTTGWWGSLSDRRGRKLVLGICAIGFLFTDANFILSSKYFRSIPGGYWSLLVGPLLDGVLGGLASIQTAMHAYMADETDSDSRSRVFSLYTGLMFAGMAVGPTLGSILILYTHQVLSAFYFSAAIHIVFILFSWFVLPESLSYTRMEESQAKWKEQRIRNERHGGIFGGVANFFSPLAIFLPRPSPNINNDLKYCRKDYNLTLMAIAHATIATLIGSYSYKLQYAAAMFGWTPETMGYWLSMIGGSRVVYLMIILPVLIRVFKRRRVVEPPEAPTEDDPLLGPGSSISTTRSAMNSKAQNFSSPSFDLALARISIFIETASYVIICINPTQWTFTALGAFNAFASGLTPAMRSVALEMYNQMGGTETGRLFGGLSIINALCGQIVGPAMFGLTYVKSVATFPRAIFFLSLTLLLLGTISLTLVRLVNRSLPDRESSALGSYSRREEEVVPGSPELAPV